MKRLHRLKIAMIIVLATILCGPVLAQTQDDFAGLIEAIQRNQERLAAREGRHAGEPPRT